MVINSINYYYLQILKSDYVIFYEIAHFFKVGYFFYKLLLRNVNIASSACLR